VLLAGAGRRDRRTTAVCSGAAFRIRFVPQADVSVIQFRLRPDADAIERAAIAVGYIEHG
jgi:hypothetical protein